MSFFFTVHLCVCVAFAEFSFTCMVGLTNALEQDGFVSGFMGFYLKLVREPKDRFLIMVCIANHCIVYMSEFKFIA